MDMKGIHTTKYLVLAVVLIAWLLIAGPQTCTRHSTEDIVFTNTPSSLSIESPVVSVVLRQSTGTEINARLTGRNLGRFRVNLTENAGLTVISVQGESGFLVPLLNLLGGAASLEVTIPANLSDLRVSTASGNITLLSDISAGTVSLSSASGSLDGLSVRGGTTVRLDSVSGGISLENVSAGTYLSAVATSGDIRFYDISSPSVSLSTVSGDIDFTGATFEEFTAISTSGAIRGTIPDIDLCTFDVSSVSGLIYIGGVRLDNRPDPEAPYGSGPRPVSLTTTSGLIEITR